MKISICLAALFLALSHTGSASAQEFKQNTVGCYIMNDGYYPEQPSLLLGKPVHLATESLTPNTVFMSDFLSVKVATAAVIQNELQKPKVAAFKLIVQPSISLHTGQTFTVKSATRLAEDESISATLIVSIDGSSKSLSIDCNSRE